MIVRKYSANILSFSRVIHIAVKYCRAYSIDVTGHHLDPRPLTLNLFFQFTVSHSSSNVSKVLRTSCQL